MEPITIRRASIPSPRRLAIAIPVREEPALRPSLGNVAARLAELDRRIETRIFVGINDRGRRAHETATVVKSAATALGLSQKIEVIQVNSDIGVRGKERTMNRLATEAQLWGADATIFSDVKVNRLPGSLRSLVYRFWPKYEKDGKTKYLGATVLPYPFETYLGAFPDMTSEEKLYYRFLEAEKHPLMLAALPKRHLRGTFFITGSWEQLAEDVCDDFYINRQARFQHGDEAVAIDPNAIGYIIPRQSFRDNFVARLRREIPTTRIIDLKYPELAAIGKRQLRRFQNVTLLNRAAALAPTEFALFQARGFFNDLIRNIILHPESFEASIEDMKKKVPKCYLGLGNISYRTLTEASNQNPLSAAMLLLLINEGTIRNGLQYPDTIDYGPRGLRYRGYIQV